MTLISKYRRIRNEYALADPQLYKLPDKNDPEALLEGVSMAGVIGLLRQLGDLAQFAAEIFHDLHEEVTATAARGHTLISRIEQLEADFPSVERTLLTQTSHTSFLYNSGVDGHPNLRMEENLVTRGGLPQLVMDSYEECRGPPQLFLLDKFDVAGAGACLKRYTDPSFFKRESISNGRNSEGQGEKKSRRVKSRAPCWKNGDALESFPSSHAKLHQLFLEESLENGGNDNEHRVKLKRRQFIGLFLDHEKKKSYMEKFVYVTPPEQKFTISNDGRGLGPEIVEISTVSPRKNDKNLFLSIDTTQLEMKPSVDDFSAKKYNEITDSGAVEVPGLNYENDDCKIVKLVNDEEYADKECNLKLSVDDGFASEIDKGHREPESLFSDSQSIANSTTSEEGSNFGKGRENSSSSISVNSLVESATDLDAEVPSVPESDPYDMSLDDHFMSKGIPGNDTEGYPMAGNLTLEVDDFPGSTPDIQETATNQNTIHRSRDMETNVCQNFLPSHEVDEENSNFVDLEVVDSPSAPQKADSWHWSSGKHPLPDEACQKSVVHPENLDNVSSTSEDSVYFPRIQSRKTDIGPPILFVSEVGAHPSSQGDHSVKEIFTYLEAEENASSFSLPDLTETLPPISSITQACAPQSSLSEFSEATVYFGNEPNSNVISGSPVGNATYLDDYGTQTIQIESTATTVHGSDKHHDQSKDFSHDAFPSDMPSELVITSNFATARESNSSLDHNRANMEHKEIVIDCCEIVDTENHLQENAIPVLNMLPGEPPMSIEPPCLPPMPPMQWRLGRFQNSMNKTDIVPRLPWTQGPQEYYSPNASEQGVLTLSVPLGVSSQYKEVRFRRENDDPASATAQTSTDYQHENKTLIEACQPSVYPLDSGSLVEASASEDCFIAVEENLNSKFGKPKLEAEVREQEGVSSRDGLPQPALVASETATLLGAENEYLANVDANVNDTLQKKPVRPRNPFIDEVAAIDKSKLRKVERVNQAVESKAEEEESLLEQLQLRKVGERAGYKPMEEIGSQLELRKVGERVVLQFEETESPRVQLRKVVGRTHSLVISKTENIDLLLEQIKNKSFNLKPAVMARPNIEGPRTNLKLAAILQKACNIRQAMAGSDEDDDADNWSESGF